MTLTPAQGIKLMQSLHGFHKIFKKLNITSLGNGKCTAELKIEEEHTNILGTLHGGLSASLVDVMSCFALLSNENASTRNVSININTEYLNAAKIGDEIEISANTVKMGNQLAFFEVFIKNKHTRDLLVKGFHTMYTLKPKDELVQ